MADDQPTDWKAYAKRLQGRTPEDREFLQRLVAGEEEVPTVPPVPRYRMVLTRTSMLLSGGFLAAEIATSADVLVNLLLLTMLCILMVAVGILWERYP